MAIKFVHSIVFFVGLMLFKFEVFAAEAYDTITQIDSGKVYKVNEIIITAGRVPTPFFNLARFVSILDYEEIKKLPVDNIQDLLQYISGVDLKTRGPEGVQADLSIRGCTFEQTLILVDGIKISDPQTGHHNLNIPLSLDNIERIEVLKGHGSRIFGPNAFGGIINIITKKGKKPSLALSALGGEHHLYNVNVSLIYPLSILNNSFSFSKKKSDGYRENTNFDITNFSIGQSLSIENNSVNLFFGYVDKKFGANNFYSDRYPNQWEHTITKLFYISSELNILNFNLTPKIYYRNNDDDYILDIKNPEWYHNTHKTNSFGAELQSSLHTSLGISTIGLEICKDEIISSNLGKRNRTKGGLFGEHQINIYNNLTLILGVFIFNYSNFGWKAWPGFDVVYKISSSAKIFGTIGKAFRIPTFTELYYTSPANLGNPNLQPEESFNYELGFSFWQKPFELQASYFIHNGRNLIDWVRVSKDQPWQVVNIATVKTLGLEVSCEFSPKNIIPLIPIDKIRTTYTYLYLNKTTAEYESKYLLDYLRNQLIVFFSHDLPFGFHLNWIMRYEDRINFQSYLIIDSQLHMEYNNIFIFIRASNLLNRAYRDFAGLPLPGRWLTVGIKYIL